MGPRSVAPVAPVSLNIRIDNKLHNCGLRGNTG